MIRPPLLPQEAQRLAALADYAILDTANEPEFDAITRLIAHICGTPMALISLVDDRRQWFKSQFGLAATETPRDIAVCAHAIAHQGLFVINDLSRDERFHDNPLIADDPNLRFYAGAVLRSPDGYALGTLCVLDSRPRELSEAQLDALKTLGSHVTVLLEARRALAVQRSMRSQLEATLASRQQLIATVSHDLRSPMSVVQLSATVLRAKLADRPDVAPVIDRVIRATETMTSLVDDLLDFETFEAKGITLDLSVVPVAQLIREAVDTFAPAAQTREIDLAVGEVTAAHVTVDVHRIRQVLANLIGNALKVVPRTGRIVLTCMRSGARLRVAIEDTGPGIPAESLAHVFDPFWREERSTKGAGLGLTICKLIIEAHHGTIGATSEVGRGTTFWFELPLSDA